MNDTYSNNGHLEKSVSLLPFFTILFKRKWIILSFFTFVVGAVTMVSFLMPEAFRADCKLMIEQERESEKSLLFRMSLPAGTDKYDWISSEMEIIQSYPVAMNVVESLNLHQLANRGRALNELSETESIVRAVQDLRKKMQVIASKQSNVIEVSYEAKDAELSAKVVNKVVETYIDHRSRISDDSEAYKFFEKQLKITDEKIRESEQQLAKYKKVKKIISPDAQKEILLTKLQEYERNLTTVQTKRISKEAKLALIQEQLQTGQELSIPSTETSDSPSREKYIAKIKGELLDLEIRREQLLQKYTPQYEDVTNLDRQIAEAKKRVEVEIRQIVDMEMATIRALKTEEEVLQNAIEKTMMDVEELAQKEYEFSQLSRGIDDNREVYSMLLKQREEARISLAKLQKGVKISIISPAIPPTDPAKPTKALNIALAVFLGILGGVSLALTIEFFDHSVNTPYELEKYSELPVLGSVRDVKRIHNPSRNQEIGAKITTVKMLSQKRVVRDKNIPVH